ncbi:glycine-rich cell wall structural protein 1.8-like [Capsicum galapagoense]
MEVYGIVSIGLLSIFMILVMFFTFCKNNNNNNNKNNYRAPPAGNEARAKSRVSVHNTCEADNGEGGGNEHGTGDGGGSTIMASVVATTALNSIVIDAGGGGSGGGDGGGHGHGHSHGGGGDG